MPKDKIFEEHKEKLDIRSNDRWNIRKNVVMKFLSEEPGYIKNGIQYNNRYRYYVEKLNDGRNIYLLRPTYLNKGFDFQVWVEKFDGEVDKRPKHDDIFSDIQNKIRKNPENIEKLIAAVDQVWKCEEPEKILKKTEMKFHTGFDIELLLKVLKWLFIEQDITYWNYIGRNKLKIAIQDLLKQQKLF